MANQVQGSETILSMLQTDHDIRLVLVDREMDTESLRQECERQGIPLEEGSTNDLWRMSAVGHDSWWRVVVFDFTGNRVENGIVGESIISDVERWIHESDYHVLLSSHL